MQIEDLSEPIFIKKQGEEFKWPTHKFFYIFAGNGLFKCRNHVFYQSCVKVAELEHPDLAEQEEYVTHNYPPLSQELMEKIVGFFGRVEEKHSSEAYVLLGWDLIEKEITMLVPEQEVSVASAVYELPNYPDNWILLGDVHSHERMSAYSSGIDHKDEVKRSGLHVVVGRVHEEPPQFHAEIVVDGVRFKVKDMDTIMEGYKHRNDDVPDEWMEKVRKKKWSWSPGTYKGSSYGGMGGGYMDGTSFVSKKERKRKKGWWTKMVGGYE